MNVVELVITTLVGIIGLYLAHSLRRQQRLKIAEQRVDSYRKLWSLLYAARPSRVEPPESKEPLTCEEAGELHARMTSWYFEDGNGMLLPHDTREMYLEAKKRLGRYATQGEAPSVGARVMRDLSLLRSQMKSNLDIYGVFYFDDLDDGDRELIRAAGLDPERWGRPWYRWASDPRYWLGRLRGHPAST